MYRKYSNHVEKNISHLLNHFVHLFIEFRFCCFYMIHHTVVSENKTLKQVLQFDTFDAAV